MNEEPIAYWDPHHGKLLYAKVDDYADFRGVGVIAGELKEMSLIPLYLNPPKRPFVRLTEEEIKTCWGEPEGLNKQALINFANAIMDSLEEPISRPFVRLTDEELLELGGDHVGPMSEGEFHLMVITQEVLADKNK